MGPVKHLNLTGLWVAFALLISVHQASADTEPNNILSQANDLLLDETMNGSLNLDPSDLSDWYALTTSADGTLNVSFTADPGLVFTANVVRPTGSVLASLNSSSGNSFQIDCLSGNQTLYIHLQLGSGAGNYTLNATMSNLVVSDVEPNNNLNQTPETLTLGESLLGSIGYATNAIVDANDYYLIDIPENGNLSIHIDAPETMSTRLFLYRVNGSAVSNTAAAGIFGDHSLDQDCIGASTYIIRVQLISTSVCGNYSLSFTLDSPSYLNDLEPNNGISQTNETLITGAMVSGQIGHTSDGIPDLSDYYLMEIEENGTVDLTLETTDPLTTRLFLYRTNGTLISATAPSGVEGTHSLSTSCIGAGTYVAQVQRIDGCGGYDLSFTIDEPALPEDMEPNNNSSSIQESLVELIPSTGHLGHAFNGIVDNLDYYDFEVDRNGTLVINASTEAELSARLFVSRTNGSVIFSSEPLGFSGDASFELPCFGEGTYVVYLSLVGGCGSYSLNYTMEEPLNENDIEPNNSIGAPQGIIAENELVAGHLGFVADGITDPVDYFSIQPSVNGTINVDINTEESLSTRFFFYRPNGSSIFLSPSEGFSGSASFSISCQGPDTYIIGISRVSGCGSYTFSYGIDTPAEASDSEPNNSIATANETLLEGQIKEGQIGHLSNTFNDTDDYYIIEKDRNGDMSFSVQTADGNEVRLYAYSTNGSQLTASPPEGGTSIDLDLTCRGIETLILRVARISGCGGYSVSYQIQDPVYANDSEPNNFIAEAQMLEVSTVIEGQLGHTSLTSGVDINDYYQFTIVEVPFEFEATTVVADGLVARVWLQTTNGSVIASSDASGFSLEETLTHTIETAGDYIFRLTRVSDCGSYQVNGLCGVIPTASIDVDGALSYCPFNQPTLLGNANQASYTWRYNNSLFSTDQDIVVDASGTYSLVTGDANGCLSQPVEVEAEVIRIAGDFNLDGAVNSADLLFLIGEFGCMDNCSTDLDEDGSVTSGDFLLFLSVFGSFCDVPDVGF